MSSEGSRPVSSAALLLRSSDYRDADRIVTLLTARLGVVSAVARGARGSRRRFGGALEPYAVIEVELGPARGDLYTLQSASASRTFPALLGDLSRMDEAGAGLTLLRVAHPASLVSPELFVASVQFLQLLELAPDPSRTGLLAFTVRVLGLCGLAPRLSMCGRSGQPVPENKPAYFDPALGAVVARQLGGGPFLLSAEVRRRLSRALGADWSREAGVPWSPEDLRAARAALAAFVAQHLDAHVASRLFSIPGM